MALGTKSHLRFDFKKLLPCLNCAFLCLLCGFWIDSRWLLFLRFFSISTGHQFWPLIATVFPLTNTMPDALRLFSNRSQMTWKCLYERWCYSVNDPIILGGKRSLSAPIRSRTNDPLIFATDAHALPLCCTETRTRPSRLTGSVVINFLRTARIGMLIYVNRS